MADQATTPADDVQSFGLSPLLRARMMGVCLAAIGVLLVLFTGVVLALRLPTPVMTLFVLAVLVAIFGLGFLLVRRWYVVRLDRTGYRVRFVRGAGTKAARWTDVEDAATTEVDGARCLTLRLKDGRSTIIPVDLIEGDPEEFVRNMQRRLTEGHGYRRIG